MMWEILIEFTFFQGDMKYYNSDFFFPFWELWIFKGLNMLLMYHLSQ